MYTPAEEAQVADSVAASKDMNSHQKQLIGTLACLIADVKDPVELRDQLAANGFKFKPGFEPKSLAEMQAAVQEIIEWLNSSDARGVPNIPSESQGGPQIAQEAGKAIAAVLASPPETEKLELTAEEAAATLAALEGSFHANMKLHEGGEFARVRAALEANPKALLAINKAQAAGHSPNVVQPDKEGFSIATCSKESPASGRNCVFDKDIREAVLKSNPEAVINGSAEEMSEAMGWPLMPKEQYNYLQTLDKFDTETSSYLATPKEVRDGGLALVGYRNGSSVGVNRSYAYNHNDDRAWRGSLRVLWT